jgi:branched-subunit amino acid ABC-type transport system permease component
MNEESFKYGFIKAAIDNGLNLLQAGELLKLAESSGLGRYFAQKAIAGQTYVDNPARSVPGLTLGSVPYVNLLGIPEMLANRFLGKKDERGKRMNQSLQDMKARTMGENTWHTAKQWAKPMALLGGLAGAAIGGYAGSHVGPDPEILSTKEMLINGGVGALIGTGVGGLGGGLGGGLAGATNKYITNNTTNESQHRALKMKNEHPYLTALPFGDMIGARMG